MVNLEYGNEVYLEDFDVTITQDFLTLEQIEALVNTCLSCENQLQRDQIIISSICAVCTDMYNDEEATYTFEEVLYSGLWTTILENAPWLKVAIDIIDREVAEHNSINKRVMNLVDVLTEKVKELDTKGVAELVAKFEGMIK